MENVANHLNKLQPLQPRMMLYTKFDWNWCTGSGEEVENCEKIYRRKDGQTDKRTAGDQNSSLELSIQVSYKLYIKNVNVNVNIRNLSYLP